MPEKYFLYFEETAWCQNILKQGGQLIVEPSLTLLHHKASQQGGLPTLVYTYYLLRSSILFATTYGYNKREVEAHYRSGFVEGWRQKIQQRAPAFE